ncbi:MAG: class I SAM-dependent methyltransferase [Pirellulales bacterium]|jgi:SAM-dependent methyltransferase
MRRTLIADSVVLPAWLKIWAACVLCCTPWCVLPAVWAQEDDAPASPPPTHFMGREIAQTMHYTGAPWLVRESRQREEDCRLLLEALELKKGQTVCDLGCGNGFYTLEIAKQVGPKGSVYAVDIQREMLQMLMERSNQIGFRNIQPVLGSATDPNLPAGEIDLVLCVDVYHEFSYPAEMLAAIRQSLAEDGLLVLAEFRAEDPAVPIKPLHKMTKAQATKELAACGFELAREFDRLPWQHLLFFKKAADPAAAF